MDGAHSFYTFLFDLFEKCLNAFLAVLWHAYSPSVWQRQQIFWISDYDLWACINFNMHSNLMDSYIISDWLVLQNEIYIQKSWFSFNHCFQQVFVLNKFSGFKWSNFFCIQTMMITTMKRRKQSHEAHQLIEYDDCEWSKRKCTMLTYFSYFASLFFVLLMDIPYLPWWSKSHKNRYNETEDIFYPWSQAW